MTQNWSLDVVRLSVGRLDVWLLVWTFLQVACSSVGDSNSSGHCKVWGADIGSPYESFAGQIAFVDDIPRPIVFSQAARVVQWNELDSDGRIGPATGRSATDDPYRLFGKKIVRVFVGDLGFRIFRTDGSEYALPDQHVVGVPYVSEGPPLPQTFSVDQVFWVNSKTYVIWSATERDGSQAIQIAGLGIVDTNDHVAAVGAPFLRESRTDDYRHLRQGGWDPDAGHFWIDHPDGKQVLKVALDGALLASEPISGDVIYVSDWVKLPSGRWAGLESGYWFLFTPTERWLDASRRGTVPDTSTQILDHSGTLWIAGTNGNSELVMRRWDDSTSTMSEPIRSRLALQTCTVFLGLAGR